MIVIKEEVYTHRPPETRDTVLHTDTRGSTRMGQETDKEEERTWPEPLLASLQEGKGKVR